MLERLAAFITKVSMSTMKWMLFASLVYYSWTQASEIPAYLPGFWLPASVTIFKLALLCLAVIVVAPGLFHQVPLWKTTHKLPMAVRLPLAALCVLVGSTLLLDESLWRSAYTPEDRARINAERHQASEKAQEAAEVTARAEAYANIVPNVFRTDLPKKIRARSHHECVEQGIKWYKEIDSYPRLKSNGVLAVVEADERCKRVQSAFDGY